MESSMLAGFSMPGNEISDKLHNFFEQDNSAQSHQSHIGDGIWPILNNNPWVGMQRQKRMPLNSNSDNSSVQSLDPDRENSRQSSQVPFSTNLNQFALNPGFDKSHPRNQYLALNGFMHGLEGFQTMSKQTEFRDDGIVYDRHNLSTFKSQHGNASEYSSCHIKNPERPEVAKAPVNFDFLGNQQQLMKSQLLGISPHLRQHQGFNDMQVGQQNPMHKQLHELQRQQQFWQLDLGARQHNSHSRLSVAAKQAGIEQSPALLNGVPINSTSNHTLPNNFMGGQLKTPSNSQMFLAGNMNWAQDAGSPLMHDYSNGLVFSNEQGQTMQSVGFVLPQLDSSLHGTPVSSTSVSSNQHSHFQVLSPDCTDVMTKPSGNQVEKISVQSAPFNPFQSDLCIRQQGFLQDCISVDTQGYQGKNLLGNASVQNQSNAVMSGNLHQMNHLQQNLQLQEVHGRPGQASSNLQETEPAHVGPSRVVASLDPTEEKLLFGTGDGDTWDASFGSWSALVEDAVRGSSHDKEFHEEWNCLNIEKTEPSTGNHSVVLYDNEKQQATWDADNLQAASLLTSKSIPLSNDGDSNPNCHIASGFQHSSTKSAYEQNDIGPTDASNDSFKQSLKEAKTKLFDQSEKQKQFVESDLQAQMPENVVTNGVLAGNTDEPSRNIVHSSDAEFKARNIHGVWAHQQNSMTNVSSQRIIRPNGWNANKSIVPSGDNNLKFHDNNNTNQSAQRTDTKGIIHLENNYNGSMWNVGGNCVNFFAMEPESESGNLEMRTEDAHMGTFPAVINSNTSKLRQEMNQGIVNRHQVDFGKHAAFGSHVISNEDENVGKYQHQPRMGPQAWDSSLNSSDKGSGETSDNKQEHPKVSSNEDHTSNHLHLGQHTDNGDVERDNSLLTGSEPSPLITVSVMASGQAGRETSSPQKFQYHPTGNLGLNMKPTDSPSHTSYSQGLPRPVIGGFEDQEQGYIRQLQSAGRVVSNNDMVMGKRNIKEAEELQSRGSAPSYNTTASASFGGSTAQFPQNNNIGLMSQNMLKLLHKVDRSRNSNRGALFGFSDHNMPSGGTEVSASDGSASRPQGNQSSSLQGFGLHLAPMSQRQLVPNYVLPSQTSSNGFDSKQVKPEAGDKDQTRSTSTVSVHSLPTAHEASERERCDNKLTGQTCKDISHSSAQNSPLAVAASDFCYERNHLPQQQHNKSIAPGHEIMDQSVNISSRGQAEINAYVKQASLLGQSYDSHDRAAADKSVQTSLPTASGRIPPFRLPSSADNGAPVSQFYSAVSGHSQPMDVGFNHLRSSGEQLPETRTVLQPSVTSGMSRQAVFSTMLHNISAQQRLSGVLPQKFTPNIPQSMIPSTSGTGTNSWPLQKIDNHCTKGGSASSEFPTCSTSPHCFSGGEDDPVKDNSLQQTYSERADVTPKRSATSLDQASVPKLLTGGNSSDSIPSLVCLHQQDASKGKHGHGPFPDSHTEDVPLPHVVSSSSGMALYGPTLKPSEAQQQNFSLLQQMQAMKDADSDPSRRIGKRLKGADLGSEASQMSWKAGQRFIYGQNTVFRFPPDCERAATLHNSFQPDGKMLSFSSRENEDISASTSSQLADGEVCSQDIHTSRQHHLQNHIHSLSTKSALNFMGASQGSQIKPQMAPSWFEQFGTYKKSQIPDMCDHQRSAKAATQQYIFPKVSESMDNTIVIDQGTDTDLAGSLRRSTPSNTLGADESSSPHLPSDITDRDMVLRPKKRKSSTSELLPWHKEVAENSQRPQSISMAELDWSQATNRLIEKVEVEAEMIDDGLSMPQSQRRLILTTQLMQQLLPSVPAAILAEGATSAYESVTYFVAKAALGDACSLMSYSRSDSHLHCNSEDTISEKLKTSEKAGDHICSEVVEDFFARSRKMEIDLSRFEKRASFLDIKMECQGLERFSIINRLGKFHGRSYTDGVASSLPSTSGAAPCRTFPQRYVTALSMPGNLPVGVYCLSL